MRTEPCPKCSTLLLLDEDLIACASCGALMEVLTFDPPTLASDSSALQLIPEASTDGDADMRRPPSRQDIQSPEVLGGHVGHDGDFAEPNVETFLAMKGLRCFTDDVVIYPSKPKLFFIAASSLLFVALGFYFVNEREAMHVPLRVIIVSYIGIPFFGLCFMYAFYRLLSPKPSVVINREGIFDNATAVGAGMLKWEEIAEIYPYDFMGQRALGIVPRDVEVVMSRQPFIKRILAKMSRGLVGAPFNIPQNTLPMSVDELQKKIEERWVIKS